MRQQSPYMSHRRKGNGGLGTLRKKYILRLNGVRKNAVSVTEFAVYGKFLSSVYANNLLDCWQNVNFTA